MKTWLIRTRHKHIFGPVVREKLLELYKTNAIDEDDEICQGNGYWFQVKETELVNKYLIDGQDQSFNPISEASDSLEVNDIDREHTTTLSIDTFKSALDNDDLLEDDEESSDEINIKLPSLNDLEYPEDLDNSNNPPPVPLTPPPIEKSRRSEEKENILSLDEEVQISEEEFDKDTIFPQDQDLEYPDLANEQDEPVNFKKPINRRPTRPKVQTKSNFEEKKSSGDDRYLYFLILVLVILLGVLAYKKIKLIERVFSLNFSIISSSYAQASDTNSSLNIFDSLETELASLTPKISPLGVHLILSPKGDGDGCDLFKMSSSPTHWFFSDNSMSISKCPNLPLEIKVLENLRSLVKNNNQDQIKRHLKGVPKKERVVLSKIIKKKTELNAKKINLSEILLDSEKILSSQIDRFKIRHLLDKLNKIEGNLAIEIIKLALFLKVKNNGRGHIIFNKILSSDKAKFLFYGERGVSKLLREDLYNGLVPVLDFLSDKLHGKRFYYLSIYLKDFFPEMKLQYDSSISLKDLRAITRSHVWGDNYPALWVSEFVGRTTNKDSYNYIENVLKVNSTKSKFLDLMWLFKYHTPRDEQTRKRLKEAVIELKNSNNDYYKMTLYSILENKEIYEMVKKELKLKRPLFNLKRQYYRDLLQTGEHINFATFNLLSLGDRGKDLIWWKIL